MSTKNILLFEPFFTGSHRQISRAFARHSRHRVRICSMPGRFWKWRMRGSALYFHHWLKEEGLSLSDYDCIIAGSMLPLSELKGLSPHPFPPTILYFHENQIDYPLAPGEQRDFHYGFTEISSALAADRIFFNSHYHRSRFLSSLKPFLRRLPDCRPTWAVPKIESASGLLYPGIFPDPPVIKTRRQSPPGPPIILWNHRWEHDKNPEGLLSIIQGTAAAGVPFQLAICGEQGSQIPRALQELKAAYGDCLIQFGRLENRGEYEHVMGISDIVLSTAYQENFGISVIEAVAMGCRPLLPDRLSYPELIPEAYHRRCIYRSEEECIQQLCTLLSEPASIPIPELSTAMQLFSWEQQIAFWDRAVEETISNVKKQG